MATATPEFKTQTVTHFRRKNPPRPVWLCHYHDKSGERQTASLGTQDETEAKHICLDLEKIANNPDFWNMRHDAPKVAPFHPKARQIWWELDELPKEVVPKIAIDLYSIDMRKQFGGQIVNGKRRQVVIVPDELLRDERRRRIDADRENELLKRQKTDWEREREEYRRRLDDHCEETLADAVERYAKHYEDNHADSHTSGQVRSTCMALVEFLGDGFMVRDLEGPKISAFVDGWKHARNGGKVGAGTKRKKQAYISAFCSWAVRQYGLFSNPIDHAHPVKQAPQAKPVAITEYAHLVALLDALKPWPYWRAWVAFACLAGPRWAEQARARIGDVAPDFTHVTLHGRKTEHWRRTPIERNLLKPILKEYIQKHRPNAEGDLLFPSLAAEGGHGAQDSQWRSSTWNKHWKGGWNPVEDANGKMIWKGTKVEGIRQKIVATAGGKALVCFRFGPAQWRHCGATAMGNAGCSSARISQWMGNSEGMIKAHYMAMLSAEPWPLAYHGVAD